MVDAYKEQSLVDESYESIHPLLGKSEIEALNLDELVSIEQLGNEILGYDAASESIIPDLGNDPCKEKDRGAVSHSRPPFDAPDAYCGEEPILLETIPIIATSGSDFDSLNIESKKESVSEKKVNAGGKKTSKGQGRRSGDLQREKMLERQKRYRERKKCKAMEIEKRIQGILQEIKDMRQENERLKMMNEGLSNLSGYWEDTISQIAGGESHGQDQAVLENASIDATEIIKEEVKHVAIEVEQITEPILESNNRPDENLIKKIASLVTNTRLDESKNKEWFLQLQRKVSRFLVEYAANPSSDEVKNTINQKINAMFEIRWRVAHIIVEYSPSFVVSRLLDGWVEEDFDETLVGKDCVRLDKVSISLLVSSLDLSKSQLSEASKIWTEFVSTWNHQAGLHNQFIDTISDASSWSSMYSSGMHKGVQTSLALRYATFSLEDAQKQQAKMILNLVVHLYKMLTPIQVARICTFYPSYGPNWVCIAKLFSRGTSLQSS